MLNYLKRLLNRFLDLFKKDHKYQTLNEKLLNEKLLNDDYSLDSVSEIDENNIFLDN